jgi:transcriptional regulator with XRE-family HTH domain
VVFPKNLLYNRVNINYRGGILLELGQRILQARQEAGLSQRQLCGEVITRNMLSQIEHGTARPSMDTLRYLAGRLGKPISYFLEEEAVLSPNQQIISRAREAFRAERFSDTTAALESYRPGDPVFDDEYHLLLCLSFLEQAEEALQQGKQPYAVRLLEQAADAGKQTPYCREETRRRCLLLQLRAEPARRKEILTKLRGEDALLLARAEDALEDGLAARAGTLLDGAEDLSTPAWNLLRGRVHMALGAYGQARACLQQAEEAEPKKTAPLLEVCCRELGDYKQAYYYACKQREKDSL